MKNFLQFKRNLVHDEVHILSMVDILNYLGAAKTKIALQPLANLDQKTRQIMEREMNAFYLDNFQTWKELGVHSKIK